MDHPDVQRFMQLLTDVSKLRPIDQRTVTQQLGLSTAATLDCVRALLDEGKPVCRDGDGRFYLAEDLEEFVESLRSLRQQIETLSSLEQSAERCLLALAERPKSGGALASSVEEWGSCPQCGVPLKKRNLDRHLRNTHGVTDATGSDVREEPVREAHAEYDGVPIRTLPPDPARTKQRIGTRAGSKAGAILKRTLSKGERLALQIAERESLKRQQAKRDRRRVIKGIQVQHPKCDRD